MQGFESPPIRFRFYFIPARARNRAHIREFEHEQEYEHEQDLKRMGDRAVDCARLESVCAARHQGFESPPIR